MAIDQARRMEELYMALKELVEAVEVKASARANPKTYYSPRMEEAMEKAKRLISPAEIFSVLERVGPDAPNSSIARAIANHLQGEG
jgi:hypothetical protein